VPESSTLQHYSVNAGRGSGPDSDLRPHQLTLRTFDARDWLVAGATDGQPSIQAAINAAGAVGGGHVFVAPNWPPLVALAISGGGVDSHLNIPYSNVDLFGDGATSILSCSDAAAILYVGKSNVSVPTQTVYTFAGPVAAGAMSVTLATPAQAANFAVGDYCYLRTGQTIANSAILQPDAEINQVTSVDVGTGVLGLAWPTAKPYAQEYYVTGVTGVTTTTPTANLAPFGVSNITSALITDLTVRDLNFVTTGTRHAVIGGQVVRYKMRDLRGSLAVGLQSMGCHRFGLVEDCRLHHTGSGAYSYTLTADSGCSDIEWRGNVLTGTRVVQMHIHEGAAKVRLIGNEILCPNTGSDENCISVRGRGYDHAIIGNIVAGGGPNVVYVDPLCVGGGVILGNQVLGTGQIAVTAPNWLTDTNRNPNGLTYFAPYAGADTELRYLSAWVTPASPTSVLGTLPAGVYVSRVSIHATVAFDSSGTDTVTVGYDGSTSAFGTSTDVSTTGIKPVTAGTGAGYVATGQTVKAYYTAGGSAPTVGKALVVLEYAHIPAQP
jgi:hypothetical protein